MYNLPRVNKKGKTTITIKPTIKEVNGMKIRWMVFFLAVLMLVPIQAMARQGGHQGGYGGNDGYGQGAYGSTVPGTVPSSPMTDDDQSLYGPGSGMGIPQDNSGDLNNFHHMGGNGYGWQEHAAYQTRGPVGAGMQHYYGFDVSTEEDPFVHPGRFGQATGGMRFVDDNGDGIADIVQNTELFHSFDFGEFVDENGDSIHDPLQTWETYQALGLKNFVDADGDGLCDNYVEGIGFRGQGFHRYENFDVDISEDPFVHPGQFGQVTGGMRFVDENGDGIADIVQNTELFHSFDFGEFADENGDTIHDAFETWDMYNALGMRNFLDADGDGLCDNYQWNF